MNILIVESQNDQYFVEALIKHEQLQNGRCIVIDKYEHSPVDSKGEKLATAIGTVLTNTTDSIYKVGIILDKDDATLQSRLDLVNNAIQTAFTDNGFDTIVETKLDKPNLFITINKDKDTPIQFACYFTNINEKGELEDVLKEIAANQKDAHFANCLFEGWRECFEKKGKKMVKKGEHGGHITEKEMVKLWVDFYKRLDTLKKGDRNKETTDWQGICLGYKDSKGNKIEERASKIFDLNHQVLDEMKAFLYLFK
jgi:hypothetical protein